MYIGKGGVNAGLFAMSIIPLLNDKWSTSAKKKRRRFAELRRKCERRGRGRYIKMN